MRKSNETGTRLNVVIVLGRCRSQGALFGIRFEECGHCHWIGDWAFAIRERTAKRERYDSGEIAGSFEFSPVYPGCPDCGSKCLFRCSCGKVACWDGESRQVKCPWCKQMGLLEGSVDHLSIDQDA